MSELEADKRTLTSYIVRFSVDAERVEQRGTIEPKRSVDVHIVVAAHTAMGAVDRLTAMLQDLINAAENKGLGR